MLKFDDEYPYGGSAIDDLDPMAEVRRQLGYDDEDLPEAEELDEDFELAPEESHVQAMRMIEKEDAIYIDVRFKPNGNSGIRQYRYTFSPGQKDVAKIIYGEMSRSDHPGVDIWAYLIRGGVPYEETAVS